MSNDRKISTPSISDAMALAHEADAGDLMSTAEAAALLFVSRPHVVKLLEQGKLKLHHKTGNNRYVTRTSVLHYQAVCQTAAKAYRTSASDEE
jgi:excisionase family DNA binding protein